MVRRVLFVLALLALVLATVSPALADKPQAQQAQGNPDKPALTGQAFQGKIKAINLGADPDTMTVETKYGDVTFNVTQTTKLHWPGGIKKSPALADFAPGDRVAVKLEKKGNAEGEKVARAIQLIPGKLFLHFTGEFVSGDGDSFVVKGGSGEREFAFDGKTVVRIAKQNQPYDNGDVKPGEKVTVVARDLEGKPDLAVSVFVHDGKSAQATAGEAKGADDDDDDDEGDDEDDGPNPKGNAFGFHKNKPNRP